jgi:hypothetical protein
VRKGRRCFDIVDFCFMFSFLVVVVVVVVVWWW